MTEETGGGDIIFRGSIATSFLYKINSCNLYLKSSTFLNRTIEKISCTKGKIKFNKKKLYSNNLLRYPSFLDTILYLIKTFFLGLKRNIGRILGYKYRWFVGYQFTNDWKKSVLKKSIIIKNPKNRFLADPFVINHNNKTILFVEDYHFKLNKGVISAYEINKKSYKEIGIAIEEKFHLSYPFLIKDENDLFMIPESSEANDIRIYKNIDFPLKWKLHKILMKNVCAADTNIIKFDNKYWMFTNIDSTKTGDCSSELHIFYSNDLITTNWQPHKNNPVIFDSNQARNGGMIFSEKNELFRVFQRQDFDMYGRSSGISKIKTLKEDEYKEEILRIIQPNFFENIKGTHSFCYNSNVLTIDFVRYQKTNN